MYMHAYVIMPPGPFDLFGSFSYFLITYVVFISNHTNSISMISD